MRAKPPESRLKTLHKLWKTSLSNTAKLSSEAIARREIIYNILREIEFSVLGESTITPHIEVLSNIIEGETSYTCYTAAIEGTEVIVKYTAGGVFATEASYSVSLVDSISRSQFTTTSVRRAQHGYPEYSLFKTLVDLAPSEELMSAIGDFSQYRLQLLRELGDGSHPIYSSLWNLQVSSAKLHDKLKSSLSTEEQVIDDGKFEGYWEIR